MVYASDVRELTTISRQIDNALAMGKNMPPFYKLMENEMREFNCLLKGTGLVFNKVYDKQEKHFDFLSENNKIVIPYYGDGIIDSYKLSLACVAQRHRARFENISIAFDNESEYFEPPIIADDPDILQEYKKDIKTTTMPQGMLVNVNEIIPTYLITNVYAERLCSEAQLEICLSCLEQIKLILLNLDRRVTGVREKLEKIKGSFCTWGSKPCKRPCGNLEGINCSRKV